MELGGDAYRRLLYTSNATVNRNASNKANGFNVRCLGFIFLMLLDALFKYFLVLNMALYGFLPVYKVSYDLLVDLFVFTKEFNKEYKYRWVRALR